MPYDYIIMRCIIFAVLYTSDSLFAMLAGAVAVYLSKNRSKKEDKYKSTPLPLRPPL